MNAYDIIIRPIITERTTDQAEQKRYTFRVAKKATKPQIKNAIEEIFDVKVARVNTMNMQGKLKRQGRTSGYRPDWKKAIITLTPESGNIKIFDT